VTNPTTFSYDFSVNPAPGRKDSVPEFFAVDALSAWPLGSNQVSVRNPRNGRELTVPGDHSSTLVAHCSVFRTLDEHVAELMAGSDGAPARAAAIRKVVESFRDGGLTISAAEICGELAPTPGAAPIVEKPVVVIITCDRPQVLQRLLNSILASCDLGAVDSLFVVDDSRSAENGTANRELTLAADREASIDCHYFGGAEVRELTENLISELPQHEEALRFLLDRDRWKDQKSYGLARNFSHLLSVGKPVVVFDDDALCEAYDPPFPAAGVAFNTGQQEVAFYANHEEWRQGLARSSLDPVAGHMVPRAGASGRAVGAGPGTAGTGIPASGAGRFCPLAEPGFPRAGYRMRFPRRSGHRDQPLAGQHSRGFARALAGARGWLAASPGEPLLLAGPRAAGIPSPQQDFTGHGL